MLKKLLTVAAIVLVSPTFAFADDIFFAFGGGANSTSSFTTTTDANSGSFYLYSDADFEFDGADLHFVNSDPSVVQITGGQVFNPEIFAAPGVSLGFKFQTEITTPEGEVVRGAEISVPPTGIAPPEVDGRIFLLSVTELGVRPGTTRNFDPNFDPLLVTPGGSTGALLIGRIDFDIIGTGTTNFDLSLNTSSNNGVVLLPNTLLDPTFGSATLTVLGPQAIPEPSSVALLLLGSIGLVARRKRR